MRKLKIYLFYTVAVVLLFAFAVYTFRNHPEVQLVFIVPGIFIILVSSVFDTIVPYHLRVKGK